MTNPMSIAEAIAKLKDRRSNAAPSFVDDWRERLPQGSRWRPGDHGQPDCPDCLGVGYVRLDVSVDHPYFGKVFACECAQGKLSAAAVAKVQRENQMTAADLKLTWDDLVIPQGLMKAHTAVRKVLRRGWGWLYFYGQSGPGKTTLVKAAVADYTRQMRGAVFVLWADLIAHIRRGIDAGNLDERIEQWRTVPLLAIDEYGRANDSRWVDEIRARILVHRHESALAERTITLFTSNFSPEAVDNGDGGWFMDRLTDGRYDVLDRYAALGGIVQVTGPSMRPAMQAAAESEGEWA